MLERRAYVFDVQAHVLQWRALHLRGEKLVEEIVQRLWVESVADAGADPARSAASLTSISLSDPAVSRSCLCGLVACEGAALTLAAVSIIRPHCASSTSTTRNCDRVPARLQDSYVATGLVVCGLHAHEHGGADSPAANRQGDTTRLRATFPPLAHPV